MDAPGKSRSPIYSFLPTEVEGFGLLAELALAMRWSRNHGADEVWDKLYPELWDLIHNPWVVLQSVSRDRMEGVLADVEFRKKLDELVEAKRQPAESPAWFQRPQPDSPLKAIAYSSYLIFY